MQLPTSINSALPPSTSVSSPILASDGSLLSDQNNKLKRWGEHFSQLLNRHPAPPSEELQQAAAEDPSVICDPPNQSEV